MAKKKHRGSSKIKYEHHMIPRLRSFLENIEPWPEIKSIIPAAIKRSRRGIGGISFKVQYRTRTGFKCVAQSGNVVQEVFIVTSNFDALETRLQEFLTKD